jgi:hypothetical protein
MLFSKHTLLYQNTSNVLAPIFGWDSFVSGLSRLSSEITINSQTKTPTFEYLGSSVSASGWTTSYGAALSVDTSKGVIAPTYDKLSLFTDSTRVVQLKDSGECFSTSTSAGLGTDDLVFEIVARIAYGTANEQPIVSQYGATLGSWLFAVTNTGVPTLYLRTTSGTSFGGSMTAVLQSGAWYHLLIIVRRSGSMICYVNGVASSTVSISAQNGNSIDGAYDFIVGSYTNAGAGNVFDGDIAVIRCWKGAGWLNSHLQQAVARERVMKLVGAWPDYGAADPISWSRTTSAFRKTFRDGVYSGWRTGQHWIGIDSHDGFTGLQREHQVTNGFTYTVELENAAWTKLACTIAASAEPGPCPDEDPLRVIDGDGTTAEHGVTQTTIAISGGNPNFCTLSAVAKPGNVDWIYLEVPTVANVWAYYNVATGAFGSKGSNTSIHQRATPWVGGSYRVEMSFVGIIGSTAYDCRILAADSDGGKTYTGAAGDLYVGWVQMEAGAWRATSFIRATTATTRTADVLIYPISVTTSFTFLVDTEIASVTASGNSLGGTLGTMNYLGASANNIGISAQANRYWLFSGNSGGVNQFSLGPSTPLSTTDTPASRKRVVRLTWDTDDVKAYIDGAVIATDTSATLPVNIDLTMPGVTYISNGQWLCPIRSYRIYDQIVAPGEQGTGADV